MIFELSDYAIDIDPAANIDYYETELTIFDADPNDNTKNFELTIGGVSKEVKDLFNRMGVDIKKPIEMYVSYEENSLLVYEGYYHLSGVLLTGESPWEALDNSDFASLNEDALHVIGNSFMCGFSKDCTLVAEHFPMPCIQMEVIFKLPKVIKS